MGVTCRVSSVYRFWGMRGIVPHQELKKASFLYENEAGAPRPPPLPTAATGWQSCGRGREVEILILCPGSDSEFCI